MAEYHQVLAGVLTARRWFDSQTKSGTPVLLRRLWADFAEPQRATDASKSTKPGRVRVLNFSDELEGMKNAKCSVPFPWMADRSCRGPPCNLGLKEITSTARSLILHLQGLHVQIVLERHIMCQPFSKEQWNLEVRKTPMRIREFAVCIAFDFGEAGLLSFVAATDCISVKVHWESLAHNLPCQAPDVYTDYMRFLGGVADWLVAQEVSTSAHRTTLAVTAILDAESVFGGMGPYTTMEVFFLAGLSPFLTVGEVFGCPSRTARLCEAFWTLARDAHMSLPAFLDPLYQGYALAATREQRASFADYLHVYAKSEARMSPRMQKLCGRYIRTAQERTKHAERPFLRNGLGGLFDVFEPTLIQAALEKPRPAPRLSHLVFGPIEWKVNGGKIPRPPDPLSTAFKRLGVPPDAPTNLELSRYRSQPFLPLEDLQKTSAPVAVYQGPECAVPLWTITPLIPFDMRTTFHTGRRLQELYPVEDSESLTLRHIVEHSDGYAVGPLEHCAVAWLADKCVPADS